MCGAKAHETAHAGDNQFSLKQENRLTLVFVLTFLATTSGQLLTLNSSLHLWGAARTVPAVYVGFTTMTLIANGCLFHQHLEPLTANGLLVFVAACLATFAGVMLVGAEVRHANYAAPTDANKAGADTDTALGLGLNYSTKSPEY